MPDTPGPDLTVYRRLLIFGGSFDPPHIAHVDLPGQVAAAIDADVVVYIPAGRAPHKLDKQQTDPAHRLAMLRLALADVPNAIVLDDEIRRAADGRPSYTVETLDDLRTRISPDAEMRLLIGTDQVDIFESWYEWLRIIELAEPVVMMRPTSGAPNHEDSERSELPSVWRSRVVEVTPTDISSTAVRRRVRDGRPLDGWVHPDVAAYIERHGLYRESD
ncbi:MAG: nicotinate (nicotinamide) nucleotide adenylyltransferase [Planctomycetota bacterium]